MERKRFTVKRYPVAAQVLRNEVPAPNIAPGYSTDLYNTETVKNVIDNIAPGVKGVDIITLPFFNAAAHSGPSVTKIEGLAGLPDFKAYHSFIYDGLYTIYAVQKNHTGVTCVASTFIGNACVGYSSLHIRFNGQLQESIVCASFLPRVNMAITAYVLYMFKTYAQTEKQILPESKKVEFARCSYKNDLPGGVTLFDCKWFTELVKDTGFMVRGHFRFQVCGPKNTERKLIWVDTYAKDGYHAPARKDKESAA